MANQNNPPLVIGTPGELNDTADVVQMPSEAALRAYILANPNATAGGIRSLSLK